MAWAHGGGSKGFFNVLCWWWQRHGATIYFMITAFLIVQLFHVLPIDCLGCDAQPDLLNICPSVHRPSAIIAYLLYACLPTPTCLLL